MSSLKSLEFGSMTFSSCSRAVFESGFFALASSTRLARAGVHQTEQGLAGV